jgi:hypothetical protein
MATKLQQLVAAFVDRIGIHSKYANCKRLPSLNEDEYLYEVQRNASLPPVIVYISGAYEFGSDDYAARPKVLKSGGFILVTQYGPGADKAIIEAARRDRVGIGNLTKLFGALNCHEPSRYRAPDERGK